jgi:hypothetical protein
VEAGNSRPTLTPASLPPDKRPQQQDHGVVEPRSGYRPGAPIRDGRSRPSHQHSAIGGNPEVKAIGGAMHGSQKVAASGFDRNLG